jgi:small conductance mechanosensitive channel
MDINNAYHIIAGKLLLWLKDIIRLLPNVALAALILTIGFFLAAKLKYLIAKVIRKIIHIEALDNLINSIIYIFLLGLTVFMALSVLQLDKAVTSILAGAGILGLALAFAFQDIAANFMSGIFMSIRRPFFKGDIIKVKDYMGCVEEINLRDIVVRTFQGQMVIIPNKEVLQNPIENFSLLGKRRMDLAAGVSYGDDLEKAKEVAINAVKDIYGLSKEDKVTFFYTEIGGSSINFTIRLWVNTPEQIPYLQVQSDAIVRIKQAFDANDISLPFPVTTLDFGVKGGVPLSAMLNGNNNSLTVK